MITAVKKNRIAIILDRSASMQTLKTEIVQAFNKQLEALKANALEMDTKVSIVTFSTVADVPVLWNRTLEETKPLSVEEYIPDGMTAMYDAVGRTLTNLVTLPEANDPNTSFLVVVLSDGQENNSKEYTADRIARMVKEVQGTKRWTFTYIGANQDLGKVARTLNIPLSNTFNWNYSAQGTADMGHAYGASSAQFMRNRAAGATCSTNFFDGSQTTTSTEPTKSGDEDGVAKATTP